MVGTLRRLPAQAERKEGTTSNHHGPYAQGYTRATMAHTEGSYLVTGCQSQKVRLSSDRSLQLDSVKVESLVIAHQQWRSEIRSRTLYTPPVKPWELGGPEGSNRLGAV